MTVIEFVDDHTAHLVVTVGERAAGELSQAGEDREDCLVLPFGPGYGEHWPARVMRDSIFASAVADVRDDDIHPAIQEIVPFLRTHFRVWPLVALLIPPELDDAWATPRLIELARALDAPVVRAAFGSRPAPRDLASFVGQSLVDPGLIGYAWEDVDLVFRPPCAGTVYRWDDLWRRGPDDLYASLARPCVRSVLIFVRGSQDATLRRIDEVIREVQALVRPETNVICAASADARYRNDVLVAVIEEA